MNKMLAVGIHVDRSGICQVYDMEVVGPSRPIQLIAVNEGAQKVNFSAKKACPPGGNAVS